MCVNPKYAIRRFLYSLPGEIMQNRYKVCIEVGITEKTLDNWMNCEKQAKFSIPSDALFKLADIFKCEIKELING